MKTWITVTLVTLLLVGTVAGYLALTTLGTQDMFSVTFYDRNKNPIKTLSAVGGQSGVYYIKFHTTVKNTGELPLTVDLYDAKPSQLKSAYSDVTAVLLNPGETTTWDSDFIDVTQFEGQTVTFWVKVRGQYEYGGETNYIYKTAQMDLTIEPDPVAGMDVSIDYTSDNSGGGGSTPTCWTAGTECDPANHQCCNTCEPTGAEKRELVAEDSVQANERCGPFTCPSDKGYVYCYYSWEWNVENMPSYPDYQKVDPGKLSTSIMGGNPVVCKLEGIKFDAYECT